jgi:hypothetical protein
LLFINVAEGAPTVGRAPGLAVVPTSWARGSETGRLNCERLCKRRK